MVIETDILSSGIWSNRTFISSPVSIATPASDVARHAWVIRSVASVGGQVTAIKALDSFLLSKPAY